jgi:hypothetical protein
LPIFESIKKRIILDTYFRERSGRGFLGTMIRKSLIIDSLQVPLSEKPAWKPISRPPCLQILMGGFSWKWVEEKGAPSLPEIDGHVLENSPEGTQHGRVATKKCVLPRTIPLPEIPPRPPGAVKKFRDGEIGGPSQVRGTGKFACQNEAVISSLPEVQ